MQELLFFLESETPSSSKAIRETTFHNKPSQGAKKEHADSHGAVALHMAALNGEASLVVASWVMKIGLLCATVFLS